VSLPLNIRTQLIEVGNSDDEEIDLVKTALILASADRPGVSMEPYLRHIDQLASDVCEYTRDITNSDKILEVRIESLVQVIVKRYGYGGSDVVFDDLDAANLMRVIDSRSGLPIAIGILFIAAAQTQGWAVTGLDFPGRFLVRLDAGGTRKIIDPFADGAIIEAPDMRAMFKAVVGNHVELTPEHYRAMGNRDILARLQGNIKSRLIQRERWDDALKIIEAMLMFQPDQINLWHEAGLLYARMDRIVDAIRALEEFLGRTQTGKKSHKVAMLLQELRTRLN
jgi:regulator of sirC expression with transglutaminase-like and TPR domain